MDKNDIIPASDDPTLWRAWREALNQWRIKGKIIICHGHKVLRIAKSPAFIATNGLNVTTSNMPFIDGVVIRQIEENLQAILVRLSEKHLAQQNQDIGQPNKY